MSEHPSPEQVVRLLRAKAAELENRVRANSEGSTTQTRIWTIADIDGLAADIALVAQALADHIEKMDRLEKWVRD